MKKDKIKQDLAFIYGEEISHEVLSKIEEKIYSFWKKNGNPESESRAVFTQKDVVLITYGDIVRETNKAGIKSLHEFLNEQVKSFISRVHILPFFPYSSDDGFSVIDYLKVAKWMGDWGDVAKMNQDFKLMFDLVMNHVSSKSTWFMEYLANNKAYVDYFIEVDSKEDLTTVFRPRAFPLLTTFKKTDGEKVHIWTTFGKDQVDLNFASPTLLLDIIDIMLHYVSYGAEYIRLDAVAFIWKEIGTNCLHLPKTHRIVQLMRHVLDLAAPKVVIVSETNVPHKQNISYFADGYNEAQMVYNFSLPPLVLHSFQTKNTKTLTKWASTLTKISETTTFFNFLASHDGIGLTPARGLLTTEEIHAMAKKVESLGGLVSYKTNPDGSLAPYELNVNYLEALGKEDSVSMRANRFLASQSIMLALQGIPGIYFHSLFGSENWHAGVDETGQNRTINREKPERDCLEAELANHDHLRFHVFEGFKRMLVVRKDQKAFSPLAAQIVLNFDERLFTIIRGAGNEQVLCVSNVSDETVIVKLPAELTDMQMDLIQEKISVKNGSLTLLPYQMMWLKK